MTECLRSRLALVSRTSSGGKGKTEKPTVDPVEVYLREKLRRLVGPELGQLLNKDAAKRVGLSAGGLSDFINGKNGLRRTRHGAFAKLLRIPGSLEDAAERLVKDATEWYGRTMGGRMPLLDEPEVRKAIEVVAELQKVSPLVVESVLMAYSDSRFLGRDAAHWIRILAEEFQYERAARETA